MACRANVLLSAILSAAIAWLLVVDTGSAQSLPPQAVERLKTKLGKDPPPDVPGEAIGSEGNPIRVLLPEGERAYLSRLRCGNGKPPKFNRLGSTFSPGQNMLDMYELTCRRQPKVVVYMDMYQCVEEQRPIDGFEIVPDTTERDRSYCN
jgi:hypothetical protein